MLYFWVCKHLVISDIIVCLYSLDYPGGGALNFFLVGMCSAGRERVFLEKCGVLGAKIWKFCLSRTENLAKIKAENAIFSKI